MASLKIITFAVIACSILFLKRCSSSPIVEQKLYTGLELGREVVVSPLCMLIYYVNLSPPLFRFCPLPGENTWTDIPP